MNGSFLSVNNDKSKKNPETEAAGSQENSLIILKDIFL